MPINLQKPNFIPQNRPDDADKPPVTTWSFSGLATFEQCPRRTYLQKVERIKEPSSPAAARGSDIHDMAEQYVDGTITDDTVPKELKKFELEFKLLREAYPKGDIHLEQEWGYDQEWNTGDWSIPDIWLRAKLDVLIVESDTSAVIIDHKTGRKFGNEIKHNAQLMLYAICTFKRFPSLEYVTAKLWYLDHGEVTEQNYTREQAMMFFNKWNMRAHAMTSCVNFVPTPSAQACKWCSYGKPNEKGEVVCKDAFMK